MNIFQIYNWFTLLVLVNGLISFFLTLYLSDGTMSVEAIVLLVISSLLLLISTVLMTVLTNHRAYFVKYKDLVSSMDKAEDQFSKISKAMKIIGTHEAIKFHNERKSNQRNRNTWLYRLNK